MRTTRAILIGFMGLAGALAAEEYEVGGPLAGVKLPLLLTQHGEPAGHPGCLREAGGKFIHSPQGQAPQRELYPGAVELYRSYMFKYMPIRSFFDRQSQIRFWKAPAIPGARSHAESYAAPLYWVPRHRSPRNTGKRLKAVSVVRCRVGAPVLNLDLGELDTGLYVVRVIGAVETAKLRPFREPLYMRMTVNDGLEGERSTYRRRLGYCDELYSVAEFYFHATAKRRYRATLQVDRGSAVDLLVQGISLDDVLAGTVRKAIKTRTTLGSPNANTSSHSPLSRTERLRRDANIWRGFPRVNAQGSGITSRYGTGKGYGKMQGVVAGTADLTGAQIEEKHGKWVPLGKATRGMKLPSGVRAEEVFLANPKLGRVYTLDDLHRQRPLPDPYPFKDDGAGLFFPDQQNAKQGRVWSPIGNRVSTLYRDYYRRVGQSLSRYKKSGNPDDARDAAMALARWAYAFPTIDYSEFLDSVVHEVGPFGRDYSCRRRETVAFFLPHYPMYVKPILFQYDELFESLSGNHALAASIGRFVPWVKTPQDVIKLIDVYLVQTTAKRILRYHYHTDPMDIGNLAAVVGNPKVTDPWMEWLFSRTFVYPLPPQGIQDLMISGTTREGNEYIGSTYYAQGEGASRVAASLALYQSAGGNAKYDLSDIRRFPKPAAHCAWRLDNMVAGWDFLRIGDVCGPDKAPGHTFRKIAGSMRSGWRWTRDPRYAFVLKHYFGDESAEVATAAAKLKRAPWFAARSRVLPTWAGILESGTQHDDPRFRRAAYLRVGYGFGHHHHDSLDLQVAAHGLPMTVDGGQRPGYSKPGDRTSRIHNLVEVDGKSAYNHAWVRTLVDVRGARYLHAEAVPPGAAKRLRRQIALIDVDEGKGSQPLPIARQRPGSKLPRGVTTPNSYVFDVVRIRGGRQHTYCFHAMLHDDFQWNARGARAPAAGSAEAKYLDIFKRKPELSRAGDAPDTFQATWRMAIEVKGTGMGEKEMLGRNFDPQAPRKHTRLHLLGVGGARALRGQFVCTRWDYDFTNVMVQRKSAGGALESAFVAIIEPFAGKPFIASLHLLGIEDNEKDADRAVAVEIKTKNGHTDVCFAGGRPEKVRRLAGPQLRAAGEFAYYSTDGEGLRQATLVGGTLLEGPGVALRPARRERTGKVVKVDYARKKLWIDSAWPAGLRGAAFEVGVDEHWTTYTAQASAPDAGGTEITVQRGADYYRSKIVAVDEENGTVKCALKPMGEYVSGNRRHWVASDEAMTSFWRADYLGKQKFKLTGGPVTREAFGKAGVLRLWEYGTGDRVRRSTFASLRRTGPNEYEFTADVAVTVRLRGRRVSISRDRTDWRPLPAKRTGARDLEFRVDPDHLSADGKAYLRIRK